MSEFENDIENSDNYTVAYKYHKKYCPAYFDLDNHCIKENTCYDCWVDALEEKYGVTD